VSARERLLREAASLLAEALGRACTEVWVRITDPDRRACVTLRGPPPGPESDAPPAPAGLAGVAWLSTLESEILAVVPDATGPRMPADEIALAMDPQSHGASRELRGVLANMVERGLLLAPSGRGYRRPARA
jgi:hypothetical protein